MSKGSELEIGKPLGDSIASRLHKVPGTPFVDYKPTEGDELKMLDMMFEPIRAMGRRIDTHLAALERRIVALEQQPFRSCADFET